MPIGEFRGDHVDDAVECAGELPVRTGDETHDLPWVVGVELGLDWSGRTRLLAEFRAKGPGRSVVGGAGFFLSFLGGVGGGCRCGLRVPRPGRKGLHVVKGVVSQRLNNTPVEGDRRGAEYCTGGDVLSVS